MNQAIDGGFKTRMRKRTACTMIGKQLIQSKCTP